jgi:hypothetical protein
MRIKVEHNGKYLGTVRIADSLILDWHPKDIQELCYAVLWEKSVRPIMAGGEIWVNPWREKNKKVDELIRRKM